ncbi:hypothetical protein R3P38DRAFT_2888175 [Favolaschia claudopus]|uniref:Uncharacterized protein n=1 Tax=Favolaschia claudopus TaxID=2862362 RepID=A0AAW0CUC8_9AGAR
MAAPLGAIYLVFGCYLPLGSPVCIIAHVHRCLRWRRPPVLQAALEPQYLLPPPMPTCCPHSPVGDTLCVDLVALPPSSSCLAIQLRLPRPLLSPLRTDPSAPLSTDDNIHVTSTPHSLADSPPQPPIPTSCPPVQTLHSPLSLILLLTLPPPSSSS